MTDKTSPSRARLHRFAAILGIMAAAGIAGATLGPGGSDSDDAAPIDLDAPVGGPFALVDSRGETVRAQDFRGRYMLMVFGYTYCPDVCPMSLLAVTRTLEELERTDPALAEKIVPVFVSIDPERDGPEQLRLYLESFHPRTVGLTGPIDTVRRMATAYAVRFEKVTDEATTGYLVDHSTNIMLMGTEGEYLTHFSPRTPPDLMIKGIRRNVRG